MATFPGRVAAHLQENEIDLLRMVFGRLCTEYKIAGQDEQTERLARFLVKELQRGARDVDSLLAAARLFQGNRK